MELDIDLLFKGTGSQDGCDFCHHSWVDLSHDLSINEVHILLALAALVLWGDSKETPLLPPLSIGGPLPKAKGVHSCAKQTTLWLWTG